MTIGQYIDKFHDDRMYSLSIIKKVFLVYFAQKEYLEEHGEKLFDAKLNQQNLYANMQKANETDIADKTEFIKHICQKYRYDSANNLKNLYLFSTSTV